MANYHIGLDFGTSQTKLCLLNKDNNQREFVKFDNGTYFLPSVIVKNRDNTLSYGEEKEKGETYRYFKMQVSEDEELIQVTNEDLKGKLPEGKSTEDFRIYYTEINAEVLVVLYLAYIYLFVKEKKKKGVSKPIGGRLGQLVGKIEATLNTFSVSLGIPTEWNNPNHIKRKRKFQSLLIVAVQLANQFNDLDSFLKTKKYDLEDKINEINQEIITKIIDSDNQEVITKLLAEYQLSVFPESMAGVNYLLKTSRLPDKGYATLDIGAGTSDIAMFEVKDNKIKKYYCSESVEIASNNFYIEYAKHHYNKSNIVFEQIKEVESIIKNNNDINSNYYEDTLKNVRGCDLIQKGVNYASKGINYTIRKIFYKYYSPLNSNNIGEASRVKKSLHQCPIIVFGGGANLKGFCEGIYHFFWQRGGSISSSNCFFEAKPMMDYVSSVDITNEDKEEIEKNYLNLLILCLGLTYVNPNDENLIIFDNPYDYENQSTKEDKYYYYDIQDAVYK